MPSVVFGLAMIVAGGMAATRSLLIIRRAVRVWPRHIGIRDAERFHTAEFLVRYTGLLTATAGVGMVLAALL